MAPERVGRRVEAPRAHARAERLEGERVVSDATREDALPTRDALAAKVRTLEADAALLLRGAKVGGTSVTRGENRLASERESTEALERSAAEATRRADGRGGASRALERTRSDAESKTAHMVGRAATEARLRGGIDALHRRSRPARPPRRFGRRARRLGSRRPGETRRSRACDPAATLWAEALQKRPTPIGRCAAVAPRTLLASPVSGRDRKVRTEQQKNAIASELETLGSAERANRR